MVDKCFFLILNDPSAEVCCGFREEFVLPLGCHHPQSINLHSFGDILQIKEANLQTCSQNAVFKSMKYFKLYQ